MSATASESIISKIQKLLALANDARGNEHEMASAAAKAQELMAEYNLEIGQIESRSSGGAIAPDLSDRKSQQSEHSARHEWQVNLMRCLAENNFCIHWVETVYAARRPGAPVRERKRHVVLGRAVNVHVVLAMYEYLVGAMDRIYPTELGDRKGISARSWYTGCSDRLAQRLRDQRAAGEASSAGRGNGSSLVLSDVYGTEADLNNDYRQGWAAGTTADHRRKREVQAAAELARWKKIWAEDRAQAATVVHPPAKAETEAQRIRREQKEAEASARFWRREDARQRRGEARVDRHAYGLGSIAGEEIGLDAQVGADKRKGIV